MNPGCWRLVKWENWINILANKSDIFKLVFSLVDHTNDVLKWSKLTWNHEPQAVASLQQWRNMIYLFIYNDIEHLLAKSVRTVLCAYWRDENRSGMKKPAPNRASEWQVVRSLFPPFFPISSENLPEVFQLILIQYSLVSGFFLEN